MKTSILSSTAALTVKTLQDHHATLATAESCTGGLIAKSITDISGSSAVFAGGLVTYTNRIKTEVLGVDACIIQEHTEVSHACAKAMAERARGMLGTDYAISTTGYAGPSGGTEQDPVGTVYIGVATPNGVRSERICVERATRAQVRQAAVCHALQMLLQQMQ